VAPVCFHYFIGGPDAAVKLVDRGHYFSINSRMLKSKHHKILDVIPKNKILVESDGPFLTKRPLLELKKVYSELGKIWNTEFKHTVDIIEKNFFKCRTV